MGSSGQNQHVFSNAHFRKPEMCQSGKSPEACVVAGTKGDESNATVIARNVFKESFRSFLHSTPRMISLPSSLTMSRSMFECAGKMATASGFIPAKLTPVIHRGEALL